MSPPNPAICLAAAATAALTLCGSALGASRGDLDPTFSADGMATAPVGSTFVDVSSVALQQDGKAVVAGYTSNSYPDGNDFLVARFNRDGSLDTTFSGDGRQTTDFHGFGDEAGDVAIDAGGKIVVVGSANTATGTSDRDHAVARYNPDGSLDPTFSGDGKQTVDYGDGSEGALAVALQPDGKIVVAGTANPSGTVIDFGIARLLPDGQPDPDFSGDGKETTDFTGTSDSIRSLALHDGKIVAAGTTDTGSATFDFALTRYDADGSLDLGFSSDGKQTTDFGSAMGSDWAYGVTVQDDGKVLAAGYTGGDVFDNAFAVARYGTGGELDSTFAGDGLQTVDFDGTLLPPDVYGYNSFGYGGVAVQDDGTIVVSGTSSLWNDVFEVESDFAVAALTPDGSLDSGFSGDGKQTVVFGTAESDVQGMALTPDGRIVLAGTASDAATDIAVARLYGNEPPTYTLTVTPAGDGAGTVTGDGISCPGDCTETYAETTSVTLTATAATGSAFSGWGGDCSGGGSCTVEMTAERSASATFAAVPSDPGPGVTQPPTPTPSGTACAGARSALRAAGKRVGASRKRVARAHRRVRVAKRTGERLPAARKNLRTAKSKLVKAKNRRSRAQRQVAREC